MSRVSGLLASIAALCVLVVLLCGGVATADPVISDTGTVHLVKYGGAEWQNNPTGVQGQALPAGAEPLEGITYSLTRVVKSPDIDDVANAAVSTNDFDKLKQLTAAKVEAALAGQGNNPDWMFEPLPDATTDANGAVDWANIPVGVYLLQEKQSPNSTGSYHPPTLVFLPTPDPATEPKHTGWLTDGNGKYVTWVYPKDSLEENIKVVQDDGVTIGEQVTYTVGLTIPAVRALSDEEKDALGTGREYDLSDFGLWDNLDKSLTFEQGDEVIIGYGVSPEQVTSLAPDDFVVNVFDDPADASAEHSGQKLVVALTSSGLNKIAQAKVANDAKDTPDNIRVFITFKPTLTHAGIVPNKAQVYKTRGVAEGLVEGLNPGASLASNPPKGPDTFATNTVVSAWRSINVTKVNTPLPGEDAKLLKGAKFVVSDVSTDEKVAEGSTSKEGTVTFALQASDLRDGGNATTPSTYALLETQAPSGYQLLPEPITMETCENEAADGTCQNFVPVTFDAAKYVGEDKWTIDDNGVVTPKSTETELVEAKQEWFDGQDLLPVSNMAIFSLPRTGGFGVTVFLLLGGALIIGAQLTGRRKA